MFGIVRRLRTIGRAKTVILTMAALTAGGIAAKAQDDSENRDIFVLQIENDVFNRIGRSDRDYTSGIRFGWLSPALTFPEGFVRLTTAPVLFGAKDLTATRRIGISVGQNLYTPEDTWASFPIPNDRPYAAWLYASFALQTTYKQTTGSEKDSPVLLDTLQLDLGLIGPAAGGEFVQNNFHTLIGVARSFGWANQLHNEPTIGLTFERRWRIGPPEPFLAEPRLEYDFIPRLGLALGNVATYAGVGGTVRIGKNLRNDFGPSRARPALSGSEAFIGEGLGWYLFAGIGADAVGRNIFLDGNTDGNSLRVSHRPFVGEAQFGLAVQFRGLRITYTQVVRTPEFFERERFTQFGSLNVTLRY
jgi:lipid A 3-O-deacylase